ncbi:uncharacterized protein [Branchiostoma lanceolatum]|uniref:uncharacterized protein n=1 Tax=Branchiostoma lanceolatum TaxID=7740 RepID=UPI00345539F7
MGRHIVIIAVVVVTMHHHAAALPLVQQRLPAVQRGNPHSPEPPVIVHPDDDWFIPPFQKSPETKVELKSNGNGPHPTPEIVIDTIDAWYHPPGWGKKGQS